MPNGLCKALPESTLWYQMYSLLLHSGPVVKGQDHQVSGDGSRHGKNKQ